MDFDLKCDAEGRQMEHLPYDWNLLIPLTEKNVCFVDLLFWFVATSYRQSKCVTLNGKLLAYKMLNRIEKKSLTKVFSIRYLLIDMNCLVISHLILDLWTDTHENIGKYWTTEKKIEHIRIRDIMVC